MKNITLSLILTLFCITATQAQITRGALPGEIYITSETYRDINNNRHSAVFYSAENGKNLTMQYEYIQNSPPNEMEIGSVIGDATPGVVYGINSDELWVSFDYGVNWEFREDYYYFSFVASFTDGEIYKRGDGNLYSSENYGEEFELIVESLTEPLSDVGCQAGELYGFTGSGGVGYNLYHSTDYGQTFTETPIDSTVAFWSVEGEYPRISRGTEPGELYLVSWWPWSAPHFKIFHSTDYGNTWNLKYTSPNIDLFYWNIKFTAGRQPGSFYMARYILNETWSHYLLFIDYSTDYGETFTTNSYELDSLFTTSINNIEKPDFKLTANPNPFSENTNLMFELPLHCNTPLLTIYNMYGKTIRQYNITGKQSQQWNGEDNNGNIMPSGVYFYNIKLGNVSSITNKLILTN
ncbi:MAG: T9SS type A sorting domain-containing protein [Bacteroidota bacterium]|nr:T9SS type A sorting domain-containing protein [Bacteroidota bacterium]